MTTLYHASMEEYSSGQIVNPTRTDPTDAPPWELILEARKGTCASRLCSMFCCDSPEAAAMYAKRQYAGTDWWLYEVVTEQAESHPMALVGMVETARDTKSANLAADEYWSPTETWSFQEWLADSIKIVKTSNFDSMIESGVTWKYWDDLERAERKWGS